MPMQNCTELQRHKTKHRQYMKYQCLCGVDNQEVRAQIWNKFVVSNALH